MGVLLVIKYLIICNNRRMAFPYIAVTFTAHCFTLLLRFYNTSGFLILIQHAQSPFRSHAKAISDEHLWHS